MDLIERMRLLEQDHEPDGCPAVRMRDITAILDALEAAREDAERYRWLRSPERREDDCHLCGYDAFLLTVGEELDAAIDQARGKEVSDEA